MAYATGIDVSNNNGEFGWAAWPHIDFAWAKAIELTPQGMYLDVQFARNWQIMHDAYHGKLVRVAYCFAHPGEAMAVQADTLVSFTRDHGLLPGDHFMLDLEVTDGLQPAQVGRFGAAFSARVNRAAPGHRCICYTYRAFAMSGNCAGMGPWRLALADWKVPAPSVPPPWQAWKFWQFEAGAGGQPDRDVFNGDREALLDFARMPADRR